MKIYIAGSMYFAKKMLEAKGKLEELGFEAEVPPDTYECVNDPSLNENLEHCDATDIMRSCMDIQEKCESLLVLNYPKNEIEGYIGAHTLIELGLAYYLGQRIFLLYPPSPLHKQKHYIEVSHMKPFVLDGKLENIKEHLN